MKTVGGIATALWGLFILWVFGSFMVGRLRGHKLPNAGYPMIVAAMAMGTTLLFIGLGIAVS
jgi:hypothetical protein